MAAAEQTRPLIARIRNTLPDFHRFASEALDSDPEQRHELWEQYRDRQRDVFDVVLPEDGSPDGLPRLLTQLRGIRARVQEAAAVVPQLIEEIEPEVRSLLGADGLPEPVHVLLVGTMGANAFVAPLGDELAVFHCLEWFTDPQAHRALIAHEDAHAWHRRILGRGPARHDLALTAFYEGVAVHASRAAVPDRPDVDYFWYGVPGFEDWLPWCRDNRAMLRDRFRTALSDAADDPAAGADAVEVFFGGGFVEGRWRTGFFLADELVGQLGADPDELVRCDADAARAAIRGES